MPIPGLEDTYTFANWLKVDYAKAGRPLMLVTPENGGLLTIDFLPKGKHIALTPKDTLDRAIALAEEAP